MTHRRRARLRHGRLALAAGAFAITAVATLGGLGVAPFAEEPGYADPPAAAAPQPQPQAEESAAVRLEAAPVRPARPLGPASPVADQTLPAESGEGRRVVFSQDRQRVWLVGGAGEVRRTYLVSGSLTDNLRPGAYEVWSRSRHAVGIDDSGTMEWFVRFAHGERAAIGFHSIPVDAGARVQTRAQLGTRTSHGCIRQAGPDARAMWAFAQGGTPVVVV